MVSIKKGSFIKQVKHITIGSTLSLLLLGGASCGGRKEEEVYDKGVQTYVKEEEDGTFKIVDEKAAEPSETRAIVEYRDGRKDTLNPDQIKGLIKAQVDTTGDWDDSASTAQTSDNTANHSIYHPGLGWLFWYGAMGHLYGRNNSYTNPNYYSSQDAYNKSKTTSTVVRSSRTLRPVSSSRGFFRSGAGSTGG